MDCTKRHISDNNKRHWEEISHERSAWRTAVKKGASKAETKIATDAEIKRQCRHERALALANRTNQQPEFDADTAEENWPFVLANYPMKEHVRENVERFAMLMSYSKPRRPMMMSK